MFKAKYLILFYLFLSISVPYSLLSDNSYLQGNNNPPEISNFIANKLVESRKLNGRFEINEIRFKGNNSFPNGELYSIITTRTTSRSLPHDLFQSWQDMINNNKAYDNFLPDEFTYLIDNNLKELENEIKYLDPKRFNTDLENIIKYYYQNGFHDAMAFYSFVPNFSKGINILTFHVIEGERSKINAVVYFGLDSLPPNVSEKVNRVRKNKPGIYFNELSLVKEVNTITRILLDNGYFFAKNAVPVISTHKKNKTDSITVVFKPGKRQRVGHISYKDSTQGQNIIARDFEKKQMVLKAGNWFSLGDLEKSVTNLYALGVYELVTIDSSTAVDKLESDTVLPFMVKLLYRKQGEYGASGGFHRTIYPDDLINFEFEGKVSHRNILGLAQSGSIFLRGLYKDVFNIARDFGDKSNWEGQIGFNFAQPALWDPWDTKIGFSLQYMFSYGKIYNQIEIATNSLGLTFPWEFRSYNFINSVSLNTTIEWQDPISYSASENENTNPIYQQKLKEALFLYDQLNDYDLSFVDPSAMLAWVTVKGDHRNHPFSPSKGYFFSATYERDLWRGKAKFQRYHLNYYHFFNAGSNSVLAYKVKLGYINWYDKQNSYIPFDRQFFAGGASSVRGWPSRELRYIPGYNELSDAEKKANSEVALFTGSTMLLEGSLEYRWRFAGANYTGSSIFQNIGITSFIDFGNAYNWAILDSTQTKYKYEVDNIIEGIAIAAGAGLRYELPIGPVRIDVACQVRDPNAEPDKMWIFKRPNALGAKYWNFHIGLGHAF